MASQNIAEAADIERSANVWQFYLEPDLPHTAKEQLPQKQQGGADSQMRLRS